MWNLFETNGLFLSEINDPLQKKTKNHHVSDKRLRTERFKH